MSYSGKLYLQVEPNGSRRWFWKYTVAGKEKRISLGHYTEAGSSKVQTSLKAARQARDAAAALLILRECMHHLGYEGIRAGG